MVGRMAYAFKPRTEGAPRIDELFAESFPHFDGLIVPFEAGQEVVGEGDPTESYYLVMRGMFRAVKFTRDGRRQVFAFYMPGDICGLEPEAVHKLTIEAVDSAAMAVLPRNACRVRMNDEPRLNRALFEGATRALTLSIDHMMMIGRSSAEERLAWFLCMLSARSENTNPLALDLAMQRQDIADYLGLTIETVSRTFTLFRDRGFLRLPRKRRVEIVRPDALARLAAADRDAATPIRAPRGSGRIRRRGLTRFGPSIRLEVDSLNRGAAERSVLQISVRLPAAERQASSATDGHACRAAQQCELIKSLRFSGALPTLTGRCGETVSEMRRWDGWTSAGRACIRGRRVIRPPHWRPSEGRDLTRCFRGLQIARRAVGSGPRTPSCVGDEECQR